MDVKNDKKLLGRWGEELAARYLKKKRYAVIAMNYYCRMGEIDIIAQNKEYVIFVEVKLRKNSEHGYAREFVTGQKQEKLRVAAEMWLMQNPTELQPRFDIIEIYAPQGIETKKPQLNHLENVF